MNDSSSSLVVFLVAVPVFISTIALEWWVARRRARAELYEIADTMTNLHLGSGQLLISVLTKAPLLALYHLIYQQGHHWGIPSWDTENLWLWILGFLVMDCAYYWFHRFSHEINFLWAAHAVHHQSEYYNLSVALRQSWVQQIFSGIFYLPLAVLGIPTEMFFLLNAMNTLSQYWIHTQLIGHLGVLEHFLNTPSHHRVHHGTDDPYVDKNYAGALIIWDRMFGTFIAEDQSPRYGVIKPLRSWNPVWANLDIWRFMWARMKGGELSLIQSLSLPFRAPAWRGESESPLQITLRTDEGYELFDARDTKLIAYGVTMGLIDISAGALLIAASPSLTPLYVWAGVIALLCSAMIHNGMIEGRSWAKRAEALRILLIVVFAFWFWLNGSLI